MEINFRTREESKEVQREAFLKLSREERFVKFLQWQSAMSMFPSKAKKDRSNHCVIELGR